MSAAIMFLDERHEGPEYVSPNDNDDYTLGRIGSHNIVVAVLPHDEYGSSSATGALRKARPALVRPLQSDYASERCRSPNTSLPKEHYIHKFHSHYLVSTKIVSVINKVVHRNPYFAHPWTLKSCTRTVTASFSTAPLVRNPPFCHLPRSCQKPDRHTKLSGGRWVRQP